MLTKIRAERAYISAYALLGHREYSYRQGLEARTAGKIADDKVIERERESHYHAGDDAGHYRGQYDLEERLSGSAAEILRRLRKVFIRLTQLRQHGEDNIRQAECDMGYQQRAKTEDGLRIDQSADKHKEQHHRDARHYLGIHHRNR